MPYKNIDPSLWPKMDSCVEKVQADGHSKESAIAICHRSIVGEMSIENAIKDLKLDLATPKTEAVVFADYPWDQCIADAMKEYGDEETAKKVCGAIRAKYGNASAPPKPSLDLFHEIAKDLGIKREMVGGFLLVDLATLTAGNAFDALVPGEFIDGNFQRVSVKMNDLASIVANTIKAIEATKTENGEVVGLPIDARNHDKGDAAGWIVGAELQGNVIRLIPKWTEIGIDLITKGVQRFFSATLDLANKVIYGGTLTNWPATRDKKGKVLLRPIELSKSVFTFEIPPDGGVKKSKKGVLHMDITEEELAKKIADAVAATQPEKESEAIVELTAEEKNAQLAELRKSYFAQFNADLARQKFEGEMAELSTKLVGGSEEAPRGYSIKADDLKDHLVKMTPDEAKFWIDLLTNTAKNGLVEFAELGHDKTLKTNQLPPEIKPILDEYVAKGGTVESFFTMNAPELGDKSNYDLSQYEKKEK